MRLFTDSLRFNDNQRCYYQRSLPRHGQTPARRLHLPESECSGAPDATVVFDNSPAIYGWVHGLAESLVPSGTKEFFSAVPDGTLKIG
jgi:hypothetical protein